MSPSLLPELWDRGLERQKVTATLPLISLRLVLTVASSRLMAARKANKLSKLISGMHRKLPSVLHQPAQTLAFNSQVVGLEF